MLNCGAQTFRAPLIGCDGFLLALEDFMESAGQGRQVGLTILKLGAHFSIKELRSAVERFSQSHPLLHAHIRRDWWFGVPMWEAKAPFSKDAVAVYEHPKGASLETVCSNLLKAPPNEAMRFEIIPQENATIVVFKWLHILFDGRGVELALHEIARLASHPEEMACVRQSWGAVYECPRKVGEQLIQVQPFIQRYNELKTICFESLGGAIPSPGGARFEVVRFNAEQSELIRARGNQITGGIFQLPYFFSVVARAHGAVFKHRGQSRMNFYAAAPVQGRRRGVKHPIFQNQPSQLYFGLMHEDLHTIETATQSVYSQFSAISRNKVDRAFFIMLQWMRRLPPVLYFENIRHQTRGHLTSFFHSHTGQFMPDTKMFCGAEIEDGWHIPTVSQPPGTGVFFSERNGRLTMTVSYRQGVLSSEELLLMKDSLIQDLLGNPL